MTRSTPEDYEWATDDSVTSYAVAGCLTLVVGLPAQRALTRVGADTNQPTSVAQADRSTGLSWVSVVELESPDGESPACLFIEDNDWQGTTQEALAALSKRGKAAAVFWNVEGMVAFGCARRGKVLASGELLDADEDEFPRSLASLVRLAGDHSDPVAVALAMAEKFTGVRVCATPEATNPSIAYPVTDPLLGLRVSAEELLELQYPSRELVGAVQAASPEARWRLAHWAARHAVESAGLTDEPGAIAMLEQFGEPRPARIAASTAVLRRAADRWSDAATDAYSVRGDMKTWESLKHWVPKHWAMEALAYTACDDDVTAALGASYCASIRHGRKSREFTARALAALSG